MSFTNITGFAPPTSLTGFLGLLQAASYDGVPFKVISSQVKMGRRLAVHQYPFRDGGWPEDMGRMLRTYSFTGYLLGDLAPAMQLALTTVLELKGPGLLIHPTIGAVLVDVASGTTAVHKDHGRVIELNLEFIEHGTSIFPSAIISTAIAVGAAVISCLIAVSSDLGSDAAPAAAVGPQVTTVGSSVVSSFGDAVSAYSQDASAIVSMAAGLPPPDANTTYGRYGNASATAVLPVGTTVATLQAQLADQRAAVDAAVESAVAIAAAFSPTTDMMDPLSAIVEAMRGGITDPAQQVRVLLALAEFSFPPPSNSTVGIGAAQVTLAAAMTLACQVAAVTSLALASAAYQPISYEDAASLRALLADALGLVETAEADAGNDGSYLTLKAMRASVIQDLTVRGASLPTVVTITLPINLPSLTIAQRLYKDASRSDQIAAESGAIHPAFCPTTFQALSS